MASFCEDLRRDWLRLEGAVVSIQSGIRYIVLDGNSLDVSDVIAVARWELPLNRTPASPSEYNIRKTRQLAYLRLQERSLDIVKAA